MRQINYILIHEALPENSPGVPRIRRDRDRGYHYVVNAAGVVRNPLDIHQPGTFADRIRNLNPFERRDFNAFSIGIQYNGSLAEDYKLATLNSPTDSKLSTLNSQLSSLVDLIVDLRSHFPEAKILTTSEIDGKTIRPSDAMNQLRLELSDLP